MERGDEDSVVESEDVVHVVPPGAGPAAGGQQVVEVQGGADVTTELEVNVEDSASLPLRILFIIKTLEAQ